MADKRRYGVKTILFRREGERAWKGERAQYLRDLKRNCIIRLGNSREGEVENTKEEITERMRLR